MKKYKKINTSLLLVLLTIAIISSVLIVYYLMTKASGASITIYRNSKNTWYRIPTIVRGQSGNDQFLFAFAEKRLKEPGSDPKDDGNFDIVVKRSNDDTGNDWGSEIVVAGQNTTDRFSNPVPFWIKAPNPYNNNKVEPVLLLLSTLKTYSRDGSGGKVEGIFAQRSYGVFDGKTNQWGKNWTNVYEGKIRKLGGGYLDTSNALTGTGHGLVVQGGEKAGRMIFPLAWRSGSIKVTSLVYSDDGGITWQMGSKIEHPVDLDLLEGNIAEISHLRTEDSHRMTGQIRVCYRNKAKGVTEKTGTYCATSNDSGNTIGKFTPTAPAKGPMQSGLLGLEGDGYHSGKDDISPYSHLLLSAPAHFEQRKGLTIWHSSDAGITWHKRNYDVSDPGDFVGYSDMIQIDQENIGIIYENGYNTEEISYRKIPIKSVVLPI